MADDPASEKPQGKKSGDEEPWTYDLLGCFSDWRLCVATFVCPCYTLAKNASFLGDDGMVVALLCVMGFFAFPPVTRWRVRKLKNIKGSMVSDVVLGMMCTCCTLIQENKELYGLRGSHFGEQVPIKIEIERKWSIWNIFSAQVYLTHLCRNWFVAPEWIQCLKLSALLNRVNPKEPDSKTEKMPSHSRHFAW